MCHGEIQNNQNKYIRDTDKRLQPNSCYIEIFSLNAGKELFKEQHIF